MAPDAYALPLLLEILTVHFALSGPSPVMAFSGSSSLQRASTTDLLRDADAPVISTLLVDLVDSVLSMPSFGAL